MFAAGYLMAHLVAIDNTRSAVRFREDQQMGEQELIAAQYAGAKAGLKPKYDKIVTAVLAFGSDMQLVPRKSYVAFKSGKMFALAKRSSKTRLDLGLKLSNPPDDPRLVIAPGFGSGSITHKVALTSVEDVYETILNWLHEACKALEK